MIWLTWRQFRTQATVVFAALAALAVVLAVTGPGMARDYTTGMAACTAHGSCSAFTDQFFRDHVSLYTAFGVLVMVVPGIIGLFWGAPLIAREFEAGTHRLAWNQSVTRTRWLVVKLAVIAAAAMTAAGLTSLMVTWWSGPIDKIVGPAQLPRLSPLEFTGRGIAPLGYAAFAFALGVAVGVLTRRTLPAIAITLAVFAVVQFATPAFLRPYLIAPVTVTTAITETNLDGFYLNNNDQVHVTVTAPEQGAWILSNETVNAAGQVVATMPKTLAAACAPTGTPGEGGPRLPPSCFTRISQLGYRQQVSYQPGSRFWAFQWRETALFLLLAGALAGFSVWWIRRRPS